MKLTKRAQAYLPKPPSRNRRLRCDCDGWWFPPRVGSRSLKPEWPGCYNKKPRW